MAEFILERLFLKNTCNNTVPEATVYLQNMDDRLFWCIVAGGVLWAFVIGIWFLHLRVISRWVSSPTCRQRLKWLAANFPLVATASIIGVTIPRTIVIMNCFIILYFSRTLFLFMALVRAMYGGREAMEAQLQTHPLVLQVPPCCCCCRCLPKPKTSKSTETQCSRRNIKTIQTLIHQVAIVRPIAEVLRMVCYTNLPDPIEFQGVRLVTNAVSQLSTLFAMYGCFIFTRISRVPLRDFRVGRVFHLIGGLMFFTNILEGPFDLLTAFNFIQCDTLLHAQVRAAIYHHVLMIFGMFVLSLISSLVLRPKGNAVFDRYPGNNLDGALLMRTEDGINSKHEVEMDEMIKNVKT